jgi:hypothetical protein
MGIVPSPAFCHCAGFQEAQIGTAPGISEGFSSSLSRVFSPPLCSPSFPVGEKQTNPNLGFLVSLRFNECFQKSKEHKVGWLAFQGSRQANDGQNSLTHLHTHSPPPSTPSHGHEF